MSKEKKFSKIEQKQISQKYLDGIGLYELSRCYHTSIGVIKKLLIANCITIRNISEINRIYHHNENIFENINTAEKAYWLGFLAGDGCIINNSIVLSLSTKDKEHLFKFVKFLESNHPVQSYTRNVVMAHHKRKNIDKKTTIFFSRVSVASPKMVKDLSKYGIDKRKTFREIIPNIPTEFINSFILGFFDADGSWVPNKTKNKFGKIIHRFLGFSLIGNKKILLDIQDFFYINCNVSRNKLISNLETNNLFYLRYGGNKIVKKICNLLYRDSPVWLDRKKNIINNFFAR